MESVEQCRVHQSTWTNHAARIYEESTQETTHRETDELGCKHEQELISIAECLVVEGTLCSRNQRCVSTAEGHVGHNCDEDMFLDGESGLSDQVKPNVRKQVVGKMRSRPLPRGRAVNCATTLLIQTEGSTEGSVIKHCMSKLEAHTTHIKDLVHCGEQDRIAQAKEPHAEGVDGDRWIIDTRHGRPDFWIRGLTT